VNAVALISNVVGEFVAGLEKTLTDYPEGTERAVLGGGADGVSWLLWLAEFALSRASVSDKDQERLFSRIRALHAALVTPDHSQYVNVQRVINKSWYAFEQSVRQAYMAIGLELRMTGWPSESEETASKAIAKVFGVPAGRVIGWRTTAKRKNLKYPLLSDQFSTGLRLLEESYPGQPQLQYEAWSRFVATKWQAKI
jgi:hypothetical protein